MPLQKSNHHRSIPRIGVEEAMLVIPVLSVALALVLYAASRTIAADMKNILLCNRVTPKDEDLTAQSIEIFVPRDNSKLVFHSGRASPAKNILVIIGAEGGGSSPKDGSCRAEIL